MKRIFFFTLFLFFSTTIFSQYSITGTVKNIENEALVGANVIIQKTFNGTSCNTNGEFQFKNLKKGEYLLEFSFIGYEPQIQKVNLTENQHLDIILTENSKLTEEVVIQATRANNKTPIAFSTITKDDLQKQNHGQDIPTLLKLSPSLVTTSDAGTGIGYSQFWIRGTDLSRINVTLNGIPMNDSESHGVFWVDIPDFASSIENIQIQRGVGTSTNGAGAFGATVNLQTSKIEKDAYAEINSSFGSFNTFKNTVKAGTGLINDKFVFDARLSNIKSDGYIDRAWSNLKSYYLSGAYVNKKTIIRINIFTGWEETYQSWNGVPKARLENNEDEMQRYLDHWLYSQNEYDNMVNSNSRTYNLYTYENQIDHYQQDYYQLFITRKIVNNLTFNSAFFLTRGLGFYEQFETGEDFNDYGFENVIIENDTIFDTDLIRRKWLDNYFYGATYSFDYNYKKVNATIGGSWNKYAGLHYGNVIWSQFAGNNEYDKEWYRNEGNKTDFNIYAKLHYQILDFVNLFADIQYRTIDYKISGIDDDLREISQTPKFDFINPKFGLFFDFANNQNAYISYAIANREPKRGDFIDAPEELKPKAETLYDLESGYKVNYTNFVIDVNLFYMDYDNQLIMTGQINDVGSPIMVNVPESYRSGVEFASSVCLIDKFDWNFNITFSKNKIKNYVDYVDNWDDYTQISTDLTETDISFSPELIIGNSITFNFTEFLSIDLLSKYVGKQYIDNSSNDDRVLDAYFVNDARLNLKFSTKNIKEINFNFQLNNFLNEEYETNAWVYRYYLGGKEYTMDGYFPQAGINFMTGLSLKF